MSTHVTLEQTKNSFIADLKALFKAFVLISNVLPVFTGFWLALYFTDAAFSTHWIEFLLTIIGSTFVMAGALLFNNWYEVDLDAAMTRTKKRPTVTGTISLKTVLVMGIIFTLVGLLLLLFTTIEAMLYAFGGWFAYVILYTFWSKRKYALNTVIGSISGAVTPLIGWSAVASSYHIVPLVLFLILFIWQIPHTFAIAIKRSDEYKAANVPMFPVVYGFAMTKRQIVIYIACLLPLPFFLGSLGAAFVTIAFLLNVGWLVIAIRGFRTQDDLKWAQLIFKGSLYYLTIVLLLMVMVTLFTNPSTLNILP